MNKTNSVPNLNIALLAAAAALALIGCSETKVETPAPKAVVVQAPPPPPPSIEIKIGHVGPMTGGIAHLGKDNENGARMAVDEANAAKIKIDGKDAKFTFVGEDDQADPKVGTTVAQKLVDAKVAGVVGHLNSGTSIPASTIYNGANVPVISGSATNPKLTEQGFKNQFRVVGRDDQQGPAIAGYLLGEAKPKTVAIIDDATAYGEGLANEVEKTLTGAKIKVLPREKGTDKTTDWKAILTKLRGRKPDAVFFGGMDATGGPLVKQARELGMKVVFAFGDGACTDEMAKLAGDAAEGLLCSQAGIPVAAADQKFLENYKKKFNTDPILYAPFTYDAANMIIEAIKKANSPDPAKYLPELAKLEYKGATGQVSFDEKGDRRNAEMTIFTMKAGKITPVAVIKSGKTVPIAEFIASMSAAPAAAPAPAAVAPAPAAPTAEAPKATEPMKDAKK
jgi:branched-chain amino acid transport system substrate-binding protein